MTQVLISSLVLDGRYRIVRQLGFGSCGYVFLAVDTNTGEEVAVKVEKIGISNHALLENEREVYSALEHGNDLGIPHMRAFGQEKDNKLLVLDLLGPSLEDFLNISSRRFSLNTVLMIADQMLSLMEYFHKNNFIHRDIKPQNFLMGIGQYLDKVYMVDFGLAKRYRNSRTRCHIPFNKNIGGLCGTARFASINAHLWKVQSRRDDLEALGYLFVYLLNGSLPWQGLEAGPRPQKYEKIGNLKMCTPVEVLCEDLPVEFSIYLKYCRRLGFEQEPDYKYLKTLFWNLFQKQNRSNCKDKSKTDRPSVTGDSSKEIVSESDEMSKSTLSDEVSVSSLSTAFGHLSPISTPIRNLLASDESSEILRKPKTSTRRKTSQSEVAANPVTNPVGPTGTNEKLTGTLFQRNMNLKATAENQSASNQYYYVTKSGRFVKPRKRLIEE